VWIVCRDAFSRRGRGTPLPTDAPQRLVTDGLHGVIRNPLIAGEIMVIWGEALWFASPGIVGYAVLMTLYAHWVVVA
jgi:protein-S-isoprenylcysteine O-methyltransferase Ste14